MMNCIIPKNKIYHGIIEKALYLYKKRIYETYFK